MEDRSACAVVAGVQFRQILIWEATRSQASCYRALPMAVLCSPSTLICLAVILRLLRRVLSGSLVLSSERLVAHSNAQ